MICYYFSDLLMVYLPVASLVLRTDFMIVDARLVDDKWIFCEWMTGNDQC